jgi:Rrf2 family protein
VQFSVGVEYAFHSLFYMVDVPSGKAIGIKRLAQLHGITETYLSKIFAKLRRAGIVTSVPGVNGGYELAKKPENISFWDIIEAVEGPDSMFKCAEIRRKNIFVDEPSVLTEKCPCLIKVVIQEAEDRFRNSLRGKSLRWLFDQVKEGFSDEKKAAITSWINTV